MSSDTGRSTGPHIHQVLDQILFPNSNVEAPPQKDPIKGRYLETEAFKED